MYSSFRLPPTPRPKPKPTPTHELRGGYKWFHTLLMTRPGIIPGCCARESSALETGAERGQQLYSLMLQSGSGLKLPSAASGLMATRAGLHQTPSPARPLAFFGRDPDDKRRQPSRHRFHFLAPERVPSDLIGRPKRLRASACHRFGCVVAQMITAAERRPPGATPALVCQQHPLKIYSPDSAVHP